MPLEFISLRVCSLLAPRLLKSSRPLGKTACRSLALLLLWMLLLLLFFVCFVNFVAFVTLSTFGAGFYCDQRESRQSVRELSEDKNVLDM